MNRNKLTKKVLAGILAAGLITSAAAPVYAEADAEPKTQPLTVKYEKTSHFEFSIPSEIELDEKGSKSMSVLVSQLSLGTKEKVQVKIIDGIENGKVTLKDTKDETNTCVSTVTVSSPSGKTIGADGIVADFDKSTNKILYFSKLKKEPSGTIPAGSYTGTVTFEASIVSTE